jgi:hypothetical protein
MTYTRTVSNTSSHPPKIDILISFHYSQCKTERVGPGISACLRPVCDLTFSGTCEHHSIITSILVPPFHFMTCRIPSHKKEEKVTSKSLLAFHHTMLNTVSSTSLHLHAPNLLKRLKSSAQAHIPPKPPNLPLKPNLFLDQPTHSSSPHSPPHQAPPSPSPPSPDSSSSPPKSCPPP